MYVYQNDKLYVQLEDGLVGVEIHSNETVLLKDKRAKLGARFELLTQTEVDARFQGEFKEVVEVVENEEEEEEEEEEVEEVTKDDSIGKAKASTRKSTGKR